MGPTTVEELQQVLVDRGLYPWHAAANGHTPRDGYALLKEDDQWVVFAYSWGATRDAEYFADERHAVDAMLRKLRQDAFASYLENL